MFTYLMIGLVALVLRLGNVDYFFMLMHDSVDRLHKKYSNVPLTILKSLYIFVFFVFWITWPVSISYIVYKMVNDGQ